MNFSENALVDLREQLKSRLSEGRYLHTLGVERAAVRLGEYCLSENISELRAAALLHDVAKDLSNEKQREILEQTDDISLSDYLSPPVFHSLTAPHVIKEEFSRFATDSVLNAVKYHTTASPDMTVFDEIIFVADFIEDTRVYSASIEARDTLYRALSSSKSREECIVHLHRTVIWILDFTVNYLKSRNKYVNERTVLAREALKRCYSAPLTEGGKQ